jgi:hypothetical protein
MPRADLGGEIRLAFTRARRRVVRFERALLIARSTPLRYSLLSHFTRIRKAV